MSGRCRPNCAPFKGNWTIKRAAREDAIRHMPEAYEIRLAAEHKKWETQHLAVVQQMKGQIHQAFESQKALAAKLDVETNRADQEIQSLQEQIQSFKGQI